MTTNESDGRTVVITGGGSGIGRAAAHMFAAEGADVLIVGRRADRLRAAAEDHPNIRTLARDVSDPDAPAAIVAAALDRRGRIDALVNNAAVTGGGGGLGAIRRTDAERLFAVDFFAPLFLAQAAVPHLERTHGTIVNVTSVPGTHGWPGRTVYGAAKVALEFATRTWAIELGARGVRVAAVAPGMIDTGMAAEADRTPMLARVPLGRQGRPDEVAWWIVNLARPCASYATGLVVPVDGGAFVT